MFKGRESKKPFTGKQPESTQSLKPVFSFEFLQKDYCISNCTVEEKAQIIEKLRILGNMSWAEIQASNRHKCGCEKIVRSSIKTSIPKNIPEDASFIALRCCGKAPMVGYREAEVFHIVWVDRSFTLYNH